MCEYFRALRIRVASSVYRTSPHWKLWWSMTQDEPWETWTGGCAFLVWNTYCIQPCHTWWPYSPVVPMAPRPNIANPFTCPVQGLVGSIENYFLFSIVKISFWNYFTKLVCVVGVTCPVVRSVGCVPTTRKETAWQYWVVTWPWPPLDSSWSLSTTSWSGRESWHIVTWQIHTSNNDPKTKRND